MRAPGAGRPPIVALDRQRLRRGSRRLSCGGPRRLSRQALREGRFGGAVCPLAAAAETNGTAPASARLDASGRRRQVPCAFPRLSHRLRIGLLTGLCCGRIGCRGSGASVACGTQSSVRSHGLLADEANVRTLSRQISRWGDVSRIDVQAKPKRLSPFRAGAVRVASRFQPPKIYGRIGSLEVRLAAQEERDQARPAAPLQGLLRGDVGHARRARHSVAARRGRLSTRSSTICS